MFIHHTAAENNIKTPKMRNNIWCLIRLFFNIVNFYIAPCKVNTINFFIFFYYSFSFLIVVIAFMSEKRDNFREQYRKMP